MGETGILLIRDILLMRKGLGIAGKHPSPAI
jgi:hypothetical protein